MWNQGLNCEEGLSTLLSYRLPLKAKGGNSSVNGKHWMNCHLFFFCSSLCLCSQVLLSGQSAPSSKAILGWLGPTSTPTWDRHEKGDFNVGQLHRLLSIRGEELHSAWASWGSKLQSAQVSALHPPVCLEEKAASRQSICTTLSCYHSQTLLSGLQRCRIGVTFPIADPNHSSSPSFERPHYHPHSNGATSLAQTHNHAGKTPLLIIGHSAQIQVQGSDADNWL